MQQLCRLTSSSLITDLKNASPGTKGFLLYDLLSRELFLSRNIQFYEISFPFAKSDMSSSTHSSTPLAPYHPYTKYDDLLCTSFSNSDSTTHNPSITAPNFDAHLSHTASNHTTLSPTSSHSYSSLHHSLTIRKSSRI